MRDGGELLSIPACASLCERIHGTAADALRLTLQSLRVQHFELAPKLLEAELVATLPPYFPSQARPTKVVVHEMISRASSEIVLLGYLLSDESLLAKLSEAMRRGVRVLLICDRREKVAEGVLQALRPTSTDQLRVFHDRERIDGAPFAKMHAKSLLVDGRDLLITSANFTFHGMEGNIEIGVRLRGEPAAEARKVFSHLVEKGVVEQVS